MALSKIDAANFLEGTLPDTNINNASLDNVTGLPAGVGGKVLQVVQGTTSQETDTSSSSYVTTGLSVNITPSSTSSKIFVTVTGSIDNQASGRVPRVTIYRDSTNIVSNSEGLTLSYSQTGRTICPLSVSKLDSPSSISQITYAVYLSSNNSDTIRFGENNSEQVITAFEIAG